jgi:hypothetical protein
MCPTWVLKILLDLLPSKLIDNSLPLQSACCAAAAAGWLLLLLLLHWWQPPQNFDWKIPGENPDLNFLRNFIGKTVSKIFPQENAIKISFIF